MSNPGRLWPWLVVAVLMIVLALVTDQAGRALQQRVLAIKTAEDWRRIALEWQDTSGKFEEAAGTWRHIALSYEKQMVAVGDDFQVCNSMLPAERRMYK